MIELSWRLATKADRLTLQGFTCTEPARRMPNGRPLPHPREWELHTQNWFRNGDALADANGDASKDGRLLLGFYGDDLAACASHARLSHPGIETPLRKVLEFDGPIRNLKALAVANVHRGRGGQVSDQAMTYVFEDILRQEAYVSTLIIARIHRSNGASEKFALRNYFHLIDDLPEAIDYQNWFALIDPDEEEAPSEA